MYIFMLFKEFCIFHILAKQDKEIFNGYKVKTTSKRNSNTHTNFCINQMFPLRVEYHNFYIANGILHSVLTATPRDLSFANPNARRNPDNTIFANFFVFSSRLEKLSFILFIYFLFYFKCRYLYIFEFAYSIDIEFENFSRTFR